MQVTDTIHIPDDELHFTFARSGGPGGQNVNKVASKALLHWNLGSNTTLTPEVKERVRAHERNRITAEGFLVIQGQRFRDQARNVADCEVKLRTIILRALHPPRPRKTSRPTRASKQRRLDAKRHHAQRKARRQKPGED